MRLPQAAFLEVVRNTPLVAIDLLVRDEQGRVLLGLRKNDPARGFWFVPGGRIEKDEDVRSAFQRITLAELGRAFDASDARFMGVFEHLYPDNFAGVAGVSTYYVIMGCELRLSAGAEQL